MLFRAISLAKKEGKKVPVNFQVYPELKESFETLCKKNNVSVTGMLTALMEASIEESKGIYFNLDVKSLMQMNQRILEIEKELNGKYHWEGDNYVLNYEIDNNFQEQARIVSLENEKKRLEDIMLVNKQGSLHLNNIEELQNTITSMNELIEKNVGELEIGFDPQLIKDAAVSKLKEIADR